MRAPDPISVLELHVIVAVEFPTQHPASRKLFVRLASPLSLSFSISLRNCAGASGRISFVRRTNSSSECKTYPAHGMYANIFRIIPVYTCPRCYRKLYTNVRVSESKFGELSRGWSASFFRPCYSCRAVQEILHLDNECREKFCPRSMTHILLATQRLIVCVWAFVLPSVYKGR